MTSTAPTLDWFGQFTNSEVEYAYRKHRLDLDRVQLRLVSIIVVMAEVAFVMNDIRVASPDSAMWIALFIMRFTLVAFTVGYGIAVSRVRSAQTLDALTMFIILAITLIALGVDAARPKDFFTHVGADIVILFGIYFVIPLSQTLRIASAGAFTLALFFLYFVYKEIPDALTGTSVFVSVTIANLLGGLISFRVARIQRGEYTALRNEQAARHAHEEALANIRSLSGLIPICAGCKKVRNDEGFWEQVESYVRDRSEADFSHSLCPVCAEEYGK